MPADSRCSPREIQNHLGCISGPLLDRIDIHVEVPQVKFREIAREHDGESSAQIRERVVASRQRQHQRFNGKPRVTCNAHMGPRELSQFCKLDDHTKELLQFAMTDLNLSARAYDRILKVARTIADLAEADLAEADLAEADLADADRITADHVGEAIQFRSLDRQIWG